MGVGTDPLPSPVGAPSPEGGAHVARTTRTNAADGAHTAPAGGAARQRGHGRARQPGRYTAEHGRRRGPVRLLGADASSARCVSDGECYICNAAIEDWDFDRPDDPVCAACEERQIEESGVRREVVEARAQALLGEDRDGYAADDRVGDLEYGAMLRDFREE